MGRSTGQKNSSRYGASRWFFNATARRMLAFLALLTVLIAQPSPGEAAAPVRILAFGDSLTAGYGLPEPQGFTAQLERALRDAGFGVEVINGGVSGDTSAGGRARIDWALADKPDLVVVGLGANDALRGLDPAVTRANLDAILGTLKQRGIPALLVGMYAPPNLGRDYGERFKAIYPDLARKYDVPLYPFFLEGVALDPKLNQGDGMHPNAQGVAVMVRGILPYVTPLLARQG
jgi:acyl-CoA thioesterase-1